MSLCFMRYTLSFGGNWGSKNASFCAKSSSCSVWHEFLHRPSTNAYLRIFHAAYGMTEIGDIMVYDM